MNKSKIIIYLYDILCNLNFHKYIYYSINIDIYLKNRNRHIKDVNVNIRECVKCGKKQHHMMPRCSGIRYNWKDTNLKHGDSVGGNNVN